MRRHWTNRSPATLLLAMQTCPSQMLKCQRVRIHWRCLRWKTKPLTLGSPKGLRPQGQTPPSFQSRRTRFRRRRRIQPLMGAQDGGPEAVPIVASESDGSQRGPAAAPTGRPAAASADGEMNVPWLRPLQMTLGIVAVFSAVLAVAIWLRRRARSF